MVSIDPMETEKKCCLVRLGNETTPFVDLDNRTKLTFGRNQGNDIVLQDSSEISRYHAVMEKINGRWFITDKSSNGVYICKKRVEREKPHELRNKDIVEFGVNPEGRDSPAYTYKFYTAIQVNFVDKQDLPVKRIKLSTHYEEERKIKEDELAQLRAELTKQVEDRSKYEQELKTKVQELEEVKTQLKAVEEQKRVEAEERLQREHEIDELKEQQEEVRREGAFAQRASEDKERELKGRIKLQEKELEKLESMKLTLAQQKQEECKIKAQLEKLKNDLADSQRHQMESEAARAALEEDLKAETMKVKEQLSGTIQQLQDQLRQMHSDLRDALDAKDNEKVAALMEQQEQLNNLLAEKELQQDRLKVAADKEKLLETVMEEELVCAICSELFIQATSLNCSHSFCAYCIDQWRAHKSECPSCRSAITSCNRSLVLDNYIDKVVCLLSDELKERRRVMMEDRRVEQAAVDANPRRRANVRGTAADTTNRPPVGPLGTPTHPIMIDAPSPLTLYYQRLFGEGQQIVVTHNVPAGAVIRPIAAHQLAGYQIPRLPRHLIGAGDTNYAGAVAAQPRNATRGGARGVPNRGRVSPYRGGAVANRGRAAQNTGVLNQISPVQPNPRHHLNNATRRGQGGRLYEYRGGRGSNW